jgi:hypothetical protein
MSPTALPSLIGAVLAQVKPLSFVFSIWTRQPSSSEELPLKIVPEAISIGWFLTGPMIPSGNGSGAAQVRPSSADRMSIPRQRAGEGPTL